MAINLKMYFTLRKLSHGDIEVDEFKNCEFIEYLKSEKLVEEMWSSPMLTPETKSYYHLLPKGWVTMSAFRRNVIAHIVSYAIGIAAILVNLFT